MTLFKSVGGVDVPLNQQEIEEYNARQQEWVAGNSQRTLSEFTSALELIINSVAMQKSYSSAVSCASYAQSTNPQWAAEAAAFISWRDNVFIYAYDYLDKVQSGQISSPNVEEFIAGIPAIVWPNVNP